VFRLTDGQAFYAGVMASDGTGRRKALPGRILNFDNFSPDRRFIAVTGVLPNVTLPVTLILPLDGSPPTQICDTLCQPTWSPDGRYLYLEIADKSGQNQNAATAAIPIPPGETLPRVPPEAIENTAAWTKVAGVKVIEQTNIAPGPNPSTYAYVKPSVHANLFRIPLH
jgi:hypothetical protein